ncbi:MAG: calcium/sodium antiporter [Dehalococcoidia bacterium]
MLVDLAVLTVGVIVLLSGAWVLLRGATTIAVAAGISRVIIGATVVAFGTSAPELVVTIAAGARGAAGVAIGNVVGSNIANVFLVLGLTAAISPISVHQRLIRWEIPVLLVATLLTVGFAVGGRIGTVEGIVMLAGLLLFVAISPRLFPEIGEEIEADVETPEVTPTRRHLLYAVAFVGIGLAALALGAELIVRSASSLALEVGVSDFVVGVVIVAVGTSLPELVTSAIAAFKDEHDLAVGNVVGSNIFNLLAVAGAGAVISGIPISDSLFQFELPAMVLSSVILVPLVWPRYHVGRFAGLVLIAGYVAAVVVTVVRGA